MLINKFKINIILAILVFFPTYVFAEKPMYGIVGFKTNTQQTGIMANLLNKHLSNIFNSIDVFDEVNPKLLQEQLQRFGCIDQSCYFKFAKDAGLSVVISGIVKKQVNSIKIELSAHGISVPYTGKLISKYNVQVNIKNKKMNLKKLSYISEEHAARFVTKLMEKYQSAVFFEKKNNKLITKESVRDGKYILYKITYNDKKTDSSYYKTVSKISIKDNKTGVKFQDDSSSYFVLKSFKHKSKFLDEFYYGRKKELVFSSESCMDTFYTMICTPIISSIMPIAAPVGYYINRDYKGLSLWAINYSPYLYLTYQGATNRVSQIRDDKKNISREDKANYYFSLYQIYFGGVSLFADAASRYAMSRASAYNGIQPYMGNNYTAVYLSLISGGAGHFYRGQRAWGYFYYHLDNILLYSTIYMFSQEEKYDSVRGKYVKEDIDKKRAYTMLGVTAFVKLIEVIHVIYSKDQIYSGETYTQNYFIEPTMYLSNANDVNYGLKVNYKF